MVQPRRSALLAPQMFRLHRTLDAGAGRYEASRLLSGLAGYRIHRATSSVKRFARQLPRVKSSGRAAILIFGVEIIRMIKKNRPRGVEAPVPSATDQFCSLAF
jgi:hypothetical protein